MHHNAIQACVTCKTLEWSICLPQTPGDGVLTYKRIMVMQMYHHFKHFQILSEVWQVREKCTHAYGASCWELDFSYKIWGGKYSYFTPIFTLIFCMRNPILNKKLNRHVYTFSWLVTLQTKFENVWKVDRHSMENPQSMHLFLPNCKLLKIERSEGFEA